MTSLATQFAQAESSSSGIGAFNINLKSFIFQFVTFLLVLYVFKRWILPPIIRTLDVRRKTLEQSLVDAKATQEALAAAEAKSEQILATARKQADAALADAKKATIGIMADGETAAAQRAALIIKEAEAHLSQERDKLRQELRDELAELVADATEKIIHEKLDVKRDMSLIERAIKGIAG